MKLTSFDLNALTAIFAGLTLLFAYKGLNSWKTETIAKKHYEVVNYLKETSLFMLDVFQRKQNFIDIGNIEKPIKKLSMDDLVKEASIFARKLNEYRHMLPTKKYKERNRHIEMILDFFRQNPENYVFAIIHKGDKNKESAEKFITSLKCIVKYCEHDIENYYKSLKNDAE